MHPLAWVFKIFGIQPDVGHFELKGENDDCGHESDSSKDFDKRGGTGFVDFSIDSGKCGASDG